MAQDTDIFDGNQDNDTLGGRLWRAREAVGMSESGLAKALGLKKETLRAWENDRSEPRANKLVTLAGLLNVTPAEYKSKQRPQLGCSRVVHFVLHLLLHLLAA